MLNINRPHTRAGVQLVVEALGLLMSLMGAWVAILDDMARGDSANEPAAAALRFDLPRIEGAALACLCSYSPEVGAIGCWVQGCQGCDGVNGPTLRGASFKSHRRCWLWGFWQRRCPALPCLCFYSPEVGAACWVPEGTDVCHGALRGPGWGSLARALPVLQQPRGGCSLLGVGSGRKQQGRSDMVLHPEDAQAVRQARMVPGLRRGVGGGSWRKAHCQCPSEDSWRR